MKTTCTLNAVLCPNCGKDFETRHLKTPAGNFYHKVLKAIYKEKCPYCKITLLIEYEKQKKQYWFTAEKIEEKQQ
jgi:hypothetical protein